MKKLWYGWIDVDIVLVTLTEELAQHQNQRYLEGRLNLQLREWVTNQCGKHLQDVVCEFHIL